MEALPKKSENFQKKRDGSRSSEAKTESFTDSSAEYRETSSSGSSSSDSAEEAKAKGLSSPPPLGWPIRKATLSKCGKSDEKENELNSHPHHTKFTRLGSKMSGWYFVFYFLNSKGY